MNRPRVIAYAGAMYSTYNRQVLRGVASFVNLHREYTLTLHLPKNAELLADGARTKLAGVIAGGAVPASLTTLLLRKKVCMVGVDGTMESTPWPRVISDDRALGRTAAEHFLQREFQHFAIFDSYACAWGRWRCEGFKARLAEQRRTCAVFTKPIDGHPVGGVARWLKKQSFPLGLFATTDSQAAEIISVCRQCGLRIPEQVAIVGVDNDDVFCEITTPRLSTVGQQTERIGYQAAALLDDMIHGRKPARPLTLVPPGPLIIRESSDIFAVQDVLVIEALRIIHSDPGRRINTQELADRMAVSRASLDLHFTKILGRTPAEEIRQLRIKRAQQLLATTNLPMPLVARHAGFANARQLSETFHHMTGQTPSAYRKNRTRPIFS